MYMQLPASKSNTLAYCKQYYAKAHSHIYIYILASLPHQRPIAAYHCTNVALALCSLSSNPTCPEADRTQQSSVNNYHPTIMTRALICLIDLVNVGGSTDTHQEIFQVEVDAWLNLRTGIVSALNYSQTAAVYTFNLSYDGQVAQELTGRADATVYLTVSLI